MTKYAGTNGVLKNGNTTVAQVTEFAVNDSVELLASSDLADAYTTRVAGGKDWSATFTVEVDTGNSTQTDLTVGTEVTLNAYPQGTASSTKYLSGNCIIESRNLSVARGSINTWQMSASGNGNLTLATVA